MHVYLRVFVITGYVVTPETVAPFEFAVTTPVEIFSVANVPEDPGQEYVLAILPAPYVVAGIVVVVPPDVYVKVITLLLFVDGLEFPPPAPI